MGTANTKQSFQDWITQQWVILFGQKIDKLEHKWLLGPFGELNGIGVKFIKQLADKENLAIDNQQNGKGLIQSINQLNLSEKELEVLSQNVIDFYQNTSDYNLKLKVKWNPLFKLFGVLLRIPVSYTHLAGDSQMTLPKGQLWSKYIKTFKDTLVIRNENGSITASQTLTLWNLRVLKFEYTIKKHTPLPSTKPSTVFVK